MTNPNISHFEPTIEERLDELADISEIVNEFMRVERATSREGRPETDGEHTLHAMFLGVAYAAKYHPELNPGDVALMFMIHDFDEVHVGDINSLTADDATMAAKEAAEAESRDFLRQKFANHPFMLNLMERYWAQGDAEALFTRGFEKNDPSYAHIRDGGRAIRSMGITDRDTYATLNERAIERMSTYASADIVAMRRAMGRRVAEAVFTV
ncbi:MAG TPA: HD domain-containing protein [Candidatus Saccharimonadales bacterium]|jgi:5'-deoxynucleotidase YfbR-like HD superfamily hydrolase|nr:HD domain-containing protein [Candidatus Saccharimonadales bacterium]